MPRDESLTAHARVGPTARTLSHGPRDELTLERARGEELLTVHDAARFLKVPISWVYEHVRPETEGRLPAVKLGKYLRFDRRDLEAYVDAKRGELRRQHHRR